MTNDEIGLKLVEVDARAKSNTHRLEEVEKKQSDSDKMLTSIALIAQRQDTMDTDIQEIKTDVKTLTARPAKRWEGVVDKIIFTAIGLLVAFLLARLGIY